MTKLRSVRCLCRRLMAANAEANPSLFIRIVSINRLSHAAFARQGGGVFPGPAGEPRQGRASGLRRAAASSHLGGRRHVCPGCRSEHGNRGAVHLASLGGMYSPRAIDEGWLAEGRQVERWQRQQPRRRGLSLRAQRAKHDGNAPLASAAVGSGQTCALGARVCTRTGSVAPRWGWR